MFRASGVPGVCDFFSWIRLYAVLDVAAHTTTLTRDDRYYFHSQLIQLSIYFTRAEWVNLARFEAARDLQKRLAKAPTCFKSLTYERYMAAFNLLCGVLRANSVISLEEKRRVDPILVQTQKLSRELFSIWKKTLEAENASWYDRPFDPVLLAEEIDEYCESMEAERKKAAGGPATVILVMDDKPAHRSCCPWWGAVASSLKADGPTESSPLIA